MIRDIALNFGPEQELTCRRSIIDSYTASSGLAVAKSSGVITRAVLQQSPVPKSYHLNSNKTNYRSRLFEIGNADASKLRRAINMLLPFQADRISSRSNHSCAVLRKEFLSPKAIRGTSYGPAPEFRRPARGGLLTQWKLPGDQQIEMDHPSVYRAVGKLARSSPKRIRCSTYNH